MPDDLTAHEAQVRLLAERLWNEAGRPAGRDEEFWHQAEAELKGIAEAVGTAQGSSTVTGVGGTAQDKKP